MRIIEQMPHDVFADIPFFTPSKVRLKIHCERRRIRMAMAKQKGQHTNEEWVKLVESNGGICAKCRQNLPLEKDHIVPIYKGGSDEIKNIQPLCRACNASKGSDTTDFRIL